MIPSTRHVGVLALFLAVVRAAQAFAPAVGTKALVSQEKNFLSSAETTSLSQIHRFASLAPPHIHRSRASRSRRYYIDHDDGSDEIRTPASRNSRMRKRKEVVKSVDTLEDFGREVLREKDRMVVVRFHAPWCKTCRSIKVAYDRLAASNPTIKFVDVSLTKENPDLRDTLNVKAVPFGHVYHPNAGLVQSNPLDRKRLTSFKRVLASYREGMCEVPEEGATKNPFEDLSP